MFTLTAFEILLSEGGSALSPAQWGTGSESINAMKNNTVKQFLLNSLKANPATFQFTIHGYKTSPEHIKKLAVCSV